VTAPIKSRTEYSARNTSVAMMFRGLAILMGFVARVVFTHVLSQEYAGVNGLFLDIINVLALSELGVGTAITYALYKPISEGDIEKQKSLMLLYKKFYRVVGCIVAGAGLLVVPFMDVLIKDKPDVPHLRLIYLLYLANSVISYMWIYRKTIVDAHQLSYIGVVYQTSSWIIQNIVQIIVLVTTKNFMLYVSIMVICTLCNNICISRKATKLYPFLSDKDVTPLSKEEKKGIFENIKAMLVHKIGKVVVNNTDNLLLSAMVGTISVSCYSMYYLVIESLCQVLEQAFQGLLASVGNLGVEEGKERIGKIFDAIFFFGQWIYGLVTICLYEVISIFVGESFGDSYVFSKYIVFVLCVNFYLRGMRQAALVFRDSMGLFRYDKWKAVAEAIINIVVSLLLGYYYGTIGIFLGTMISTITTSLWVEPYILYKHKLEKKPTMYFVKYFTFAAVTCGQWAGLDYVCGFIGGNPWLLIFAKLGICFVVINVVNYILYSRTKEFKLLCEKMRFVLEKRFRREVDG